jgi:hypothetical protein
MQRVALTLQVATDARHAWLRVFDAQTPLAGRRRSRRVNFTDRVFARLADALSEQALLQFARDVADQLDLLEPYVVTDASGQPRVVLPPWMPHALSRMRWVVRDPERHDDPPDPSNELAVAVFEWRAEERRFGVVNRLQQAFNRPPLATHPLYAWAWDAFRRQNEQIILFQA